MDKSLLEFPFFCLNKMGLLLSRRDTKATLLQVANQLIAVVNLAICIANYCYVGKDLFKIIDNTESTFVIAHILLKTFFGFYWKNEILKVTKGVKFFWKSDDCSDTTKKEIAKIAVFVSFFQKMFTFSAVSLVVTFLAPTSLIRKQLPVGIFCISEEPWLYYSVWASYSFLMLISVTTICSLDNLFLGLFYTVIIQFKILGDRLTQLNVEAIDSKETLKNYQENLQVCIEYHKFLLGFIKELQGICSIMFGIQYLTSAPLLCFELYATFESPNASLRIQHFIGTVDLVAQLCFYCIPAEYMVAEISSFSDAIYSINWYGKHFIPLKKSTQLMIQRAQQEIRLSAMGLVDINTRTLVTVLRTSLSIVTILRNLKNVKE